VRKLFTTRRRIAIVVGASAVVLAGGGAAFAYFTASGSGTGQATVGSAAQWSVTAGTPSGTMLPGQGSTTIVFTVKNVGQGNQKDDSDTVTIPTSGSDVTSQGVDVPGCLATWFAANITTDNASGVDFTPGQTETVTVTMTMSDAATSQDACESALPDVTLSVS
jgi:archaellum component FlaG (FlaF/FlaG flagellin family)